MATRKRFTDKYIAALKPKKERYEEVEGGGLRIRVTRRGVKSWGWLYRFDRVPIRMTFGQYPAMGLGSARLELAKARKALEEGIDPGKKLVAERRAERNAETVEELVEAYLEGHARPKKRTAAEDERCLKKDVVPRWGQRKARSITTQEIINLLDDIVDRGAPLMANRTGSIVSRMFRWAKRKGIVDINPATDIERPGKERARQRDLNASEIQKFWRGLDDLSIAPSIRLALRFLLVVGQRRGEVVRAPKEEFDLQERLWKIPGARTKNGRPHAVPLSPLACTIFDEAMAISGDSPFLFPSPLYSDRPLSLDAVTHALQLNREKLEIEDVVVHDLRRTASTNLAALKVPKHVRERILNHSLGRLDQSYDQYEYLDEKRAGLELWAERLQVIVRTDEKIVSLDVVPA